MNIHYTNFKLGEIISQNPVSRIVERKKTRRSKSGSKIRLGMSTAGEKREWFFRPQSKRFWPFENFSSQIALFLAITQELIRGVWWKLKEEWLSFNHPPCRRAAGRAGRPAGTSREKEIVYRPPAGSSTILAWDATFNLDSPWERKETWSLSQGFCDLKSDVGHAMSNENCSLH